VLRLAERQGDTALCVVSHRMVAVASMFLGRLARIIHEPSACPERWWWRSRLKSPSGARSVRLVNNPGLELV
jgi:hypothetical protein